MSTHKRLCEAWSQQGPSPSRDFDALIAVSSRSNPGTAGSGGKTGTQAAVDADLGTGDEAGLNSGSYRVCHATETVRLQGRFESRDAVSLMSNR